MSNGTILLLIVAAVLGFWAVGAYNRLVRLRNVIAERFGQVEAQLRQRHDGIQQVAVQATSGVEPLPPERGVLDAAGQQARSALDLARRYPGSAGPVTSLALAEQVLDDALERLLQATGRDGLDTALDALAATSSQLGFARQQFNASVADYNRAVRQSPTHILSRVFGFSPTAELADPPAAGRGPADNNGS